MATIITIYDEDLIKINKYLDNYIMQRYKSTIILEKEIKLEIKKELFKMLLEQEFTLENIQTGDKKC